MFTLKRYQERVLQAVDDYLGNVSQYGAAEAFTRATQRQYVDVPALPDLPYVCVRVPTGGGKTLLASHTIGLAAHTLLHADHVVCLWLVPSNAIRDQTLAALRDLQHPYRQALESRLTGTVSVLGLDEALYISRATITGGTTVIVATLAALRVEDQEGRKIYEPSGALAHHFSGLPPSLMATLERNGDGIIPPSLANVLRLWRPVTIVDEAHNARTPLSFETLARFAPSCILEFTATPQIEHTPAQGVYGSNILAHVSAAELKAEDMLKLPIKLQAIGRWQDVLSHAVQLQLHLENESRLEQDATGEYLRPIVLVHAQPHSQRKETLDVETVYAALRGQLGVPEEQLAIATGAVRDIEDVDLADPGCPIRFIITVAALREGWDCPFAYILASVADLGSTRAVEQLLGRVLRMPAVRRKQREDLNYAYALAASPRFITAAHSLKDALVDNGFERLEAEDLVTTVSGEGGLFPTVPVTTALDLTALPARLRDRVHFDPETTSVTITGTLSGDDLTALSAVLPAGLMERVVETVPPPAPPPTTLQIPLLAVRLNGGPTEPLDEAHLLAGGLDLTKVDATLSESEFPPRLGVGTEVEVDVGPTGKIKIRWVGDLQEQLALLLGDAGWTVATLADWLDRSFAHPDIPQSQSSVFIYRIIEGLVAARQVTVAQLARDRYRLMTAVAKKLGTARHQLMAQTFEQLSLGTAAGRIEVTPDIVFALCESMYAPNWYYEGAYEFRKHAFPRIGELPPKGLEYEWAVFLDNAQEVRRWVRNLSGGDRGFFLVRSGGRAFPDFIAELQDGRILALETKGDHLWSNEDSTIKRIVGALWTERSGGRCVYVMPKGGDQQALRRVLGRSDSRQATSTE